MEENVKKSTRTRKSRSAKSETDAKVSTTDTSETAAPKRKVVNTLPLDMAVSCVCAIAPGSLTYQSKRMQGVNYEWDEFGSEQYIDLAELQSMRASNPRFFEENWILINDDEVLEFLHADKFYTSVKTIEDIYGLLESSSADIDKKVTGLSNSLKGTIAFLARKDIDRGKLDSNACIRALERATGYTLI